MVSIRIVRSRPETMASMRDDRIAVFQLAHPAVRRRRPGHGRHGAAGAGGAASAEILIGRHELAVEVASPAAFPRIVSLTWTFGWSYGDLNPGPLICPTRAGRVEPPPVAIHGIDLRRYRQLPGAHRWPDPPGVEVQGIPKGGRQADHPQPIDIGGSPAPTRRVCRPGPT